MFSAKPENTNSDRINWTQIILQNNKWVMIPLSSPLKCKMLDGHFFVHDSKSSVIIMNQLKDPLMFYIAAQIL